MAVIFTAEGDGDRHLERVLARIKSEGGTHAGDGTSGEFKIQGFGGDYRVEGGVLTLTVTKKPVFVPDSMIETWLKQNFG